MKNETIIQNAFERLRKAEQSAARNALREALANAMEWALLSHDEEHQKHIVLGDNYGWAVVHDGEIVDMDIKAHHGKEGSAKKGLSDIASSCKGQGWVGILMAGMGSKSDYYSVNYEMDILNSTMDFTRDNFSKFFRKI